MLKPEFRPSQLPEFTPPAQVQPALRKAVATCALLTLAATLGLAYVLLARHLSRLALAPALAFGALLGVHLGLVLVARLRQGLWLGLTGLVITALAALAATSAAGLVDPGERLNPGGGDLAPSDAAAEHWLLHSARTLADHAAPLVVSLGALISSAFAVHNARPR